MRTAQLLCLTVSLTPFTWGYVWFCGAVLCSHYEIHYIHFTLTCVDCCRNQPYTDFFFFVSQEITDITRSKTMVPTVSK